MSTAAPGTALRFWSDDRPAIARRRRGRGFAYFDPDGRPVRDAGTLERIRRLAVPPAWTEVRICPFDDGHLQATGRDARGRKQYRYHAAFRARREAAKFDRLAEFGRRLPALRARVEADLARPGLPREKVLAGIVRLLELTLVRVGNEEYARLNRSFGLTTLRGRHASVRGGSIRFRFRAKGGAIREVGLRDRRLARLVMRCQDLPGQDLFQYLDDDGTPHPVSSDDVNDYLRGAARIDVTAKTFRTWAATVLAHRALRSRSADVEHGPSGRNGVVEAMRVVAERLGNTPAVARRSYVHPRIIEAFDAAPAGGAEASGPGPAGSDGPAGTDGPPTRAEELAVIRMLEARPRRGAGRAAPA